MHPMAPPPPRDPKRWRVESDYHREQLKRGGMIVDLAVASILLLKLVFRLVSLLPRLAFRLWIKYRKKQAAR